MIEINEIKPIMVNNYKELAGALKKFFVEYTISNNWEISVDYLNGVMNEDDILSFADSEHIGDFMSSYEVLFCGDNKAVKHFFQRIGSGNLIKCDFPALVTPVGIIQMKDVCNLDNYRLEAFDDLVVDTYSLNEVSNKFRKNMFVYLEVKEGCFNPIKKSKEEVIEFIKKNKVTFLKRVNEDKFVRSKEFWVGSYSDNGYLSEKHIIISKTAKNDTIKEVYRSIPQFYFN